MIPITMRLGKNPGQKKGRHIGRQTKSIPSQIGWPVTVVDSDGTSSHRFGSHGLGSYGSSSHGSGSRALALALAFMILALCRSYAKRPCLIRSCTIAFSKYHAPRALTLSQYL